MSDTIAAIATAPGAAGDILLGPAGQAVFGAVRQGGAAFAADHRRSSFYHSAVPVFDRSGFFHARAFSFRRIRLYFITRKRSVPTIAAFRQ